MTLLGGLLRRLPRFAAATLCVLWSVDVLGADVSLPPALQAALIAKIAAYDHNLAERAGSVLQVLVLEKNNDDESSHAAEQMRAALGGLKKMAGLPLSASPMVYSDAASLAKECAGRSISILYIANGFSSDDIRAIAAALDGVSLISVSMTPGDVPAGAVVGFDLVAGKPQILINLIQARRQKVSFSANLLQLAKVFK